MSNYHNEKEWKLVELEDGRVELDTSHEYTLSELDKMNRGLIEKCEASGLEGCHLTFNGDHDDSYWVYPYVSVWGYRRLNKDERDMQEKETAILKIASEMNLSHEEARVILKLRERDFNIVKEKHNDY